MKIIGLTGSIGMGKSTTATMLKRLGVGVFDADRVAHNLTAPIHGKALPEIENAFPNTVINGVLDRQKLGALVFANPPLKQKLEKILHPMIENLRAKFIKDQRILGRKFIVLDIPLLFEAGIDKKCDFTMVVYCSPFLQRRRVLKRRGMTLLKFNQILKTQMASHIKIRRANLALNTGLGKAPLFHSLRKLLNQEI